MSKRYIMRKFRTHGTLYHYQIIGAADPLPTREDELPFNIITLDGTSATTITINSSLPTAIRKE